MPTSRAEQFYGLPLPVRVYSLFRRCSGRLSDSVVSFNRDVMEGVNDVLCQFCLQTYSNYSSFWIPGCWIRRSSESLYYVTQDFAFCRQKYRLRHCLSQMQLGAVWSVIMHLFYTGKSLRLCLIKKNLFVRKWYVILQIIFINETNLARKWNNLPPH